MSTPSSGLPDLSSHAPLAAKLHPPGSHPLQVPRSTIAQRLADHPFVKLVLVSAPAGFGKTTVMTQARERLELTGTATAWLTLDAADNDVSRFLGGLAAAVAQLGLEPQPRGAPLEALEALEAQAREDLPFALFLDEVELIQEPAVLGLLREVIERLPRRGQLVIGSRSLPDLGLGRLRARGQLLEIDAGLLRFSLAEAEELFRLHGAPALSPQTLARLHEKTEGWVTALWLLSMALERHPAARDFVERFSGSSRVVADYLAEEVLARQPQEVRDFLLRTSILRQLNVPACQALMPRIDCTRILQQLEASHLFVMPVADAEGSWRYHSLFADFLRAQLAREYPDDVERLHLAASGWYETQGRPVPAIDHAIEGRDYPYAIELLSKHAEHFLEQGRMRLLDRWFAALPVELLREQPQLQVVALWAQCFTHGAWEAMRRLETSDCEASVDAVVQAHVNALRPALLALMDRSEEAYAVGRAHLRRLPTHSVFADTVLSNSMAHLASVLGQAHEAHRMLDDARRTQGGSMFNRMYTESVEGAIDLKEGRLRQATARFRIAVGATPHVASYTHANGNAWAGVLYAGAVYEVNDLEAAERLLNVYLPLARDVGLPDHMIASHRMRARILFERGDVDAALQVLTELEYLGHDRQLPRVVASAKLERARMLVLQGNGPAAREELARADDAALWDRVSRWYLQAHELDDMLIGRLRCQIHFGDARDALAQIEPALAQAESASRLHRGLKLRVLAALARHRSGDVAGATAAMEAMLRQAAREGFVRLILDEGSAVAPLIRRVHAATRDTRGSDDPIFAEYLERLLGLLGGAASIEESEAATAGTPTLTEPLTRKEMHVLQLLAEGYSNSAMSEKLFVSSSTIRTHLRNINMKLGARSRTHAVAIARKLRVIR